MLYVSSSYLKHEKIKDSVEELARNGFKNIELSGGTKYYQRYEKDLLELKDKYNLNYLLHNYFPPPKQDFILNLASLNDEIYQKTLKHYEEAISLSTKLGAKKFGFHAGFFIDFNTKEVGKNISRNEFYNYNKDKAIKRFCQGYNYLKEKASGIELYIENNVLSYANAKTFQVQQPFMLTDYNGYAELKSFIDFKLLLDVAHLKVSVNSLRLDFAGQLNKMIPISDYIHLSDNDGLHDQNRCFSADSNILNILKAYNFSNKTVTIETYGSISDIKLSQLVLERSLWLDSSSSSTRLELNKWKR